MTATSGQTPAAVTIAPYAGFSGTIQGAAVTSGSGTLSITTALNNGTGDVTPNTLPVDNANTAYTPVLYLSFYNGGTQNISFGPNSPALTLTKTGGFGSMTQCILDVYTNNNGTGKTWTLTGITGTITGSTATIPTKSLPAPNTVDFNPGQQVIAVACK